MDFKTKFNIGDEVFTIDTRTLQIKKFKVARIAVSMTESSQSASLYPDTSYLSDSYEDDKCFPSQDELLKYIKENDEPF